MKNSKDFLNASNYVKKLKKIPTNDELLVLYKYFKQATEGNNNTPKPRLLDLKGTSKWNAWNTVKDINIHDCEVMYIKYVNSMIKKYGIK